jgi:hypothetical protein
MSHCRQGAKTMGNIPTQMQRTRWQAPLPQSRCRSGVAPPRPSAVTAQAHRKSTADLAASALAKHTRRATRHGEADDEVRPMDSETMKKEPFVSRTSTKCGFVQGTLHLSLWSGKHREVGVFVLGTLLIIEKYFAS